MANEITPKTKIQTLAELFEKQKSAFAGVLPKHLSVSKMLQIAIAAAQRNPGLLDCTPASLINAMLIASELGLEVGGAKKQAWLVPFNNSKTGKKEATFIPDYRGIMELCRRSGKVTNISGACVYEGDKFDYDLGTDPYLRHKPGGSVDDPKKITHAYVVFKLVEGETQFFVMDRAQIEKRRAVSKAKDATFWTDWYPEMALKTVIKRGCVFMPQSTELSRAIELDDRHEAGDIEIDYIEIPSLTESASGPKEKATEKKPEASQSEKQAPPPAETPKNAETPQGEASGKKTDEKKSMSDKILALLTELAPSAPEDQADLLEHASEFEGEDGPVAGKRKIGDLTEKRLNHVYLKLKKLKEGNASKTTA